MVARSGRDTLSVTVLWVPAMRPYWQFTLNAFSRGLAYRQNLLLRVVANFVGVLIQVAIWRALLTDHAAAEVTLPEMVTYAILSTCIGILQLGGVMSSVDQRLNSGTIAVDLVRPLSYPFYLAADSLGTTVFSGLFAMLPTLALAALAFGLTPPASPAAFAGFLVAVIIAMAMGFAFGHLAALLAFWMLTTLVFEWTLLGFMKLFADTFLPLWFFPGWLAAIAGWLPFRYLSFVPIAVYLGRIPPDQLGSTLLLGAAWTVGLLGLCGWL